jgi:hypothetical protein
VTLDEVTRARRNYELVGAVSRELLAVETDNRLTIYTDQRRGIFKIIIVRYIRIAPRISNHHIEV